MKKKNILLGLGAIGLGLTLASCGGNIKPTPELEPTIEKPEIHAEFEGAINSSHIDVDSKNKRLKIVLDPYIEEYNLSNVRFINVINVVYKTPEGKIIDHLNYAPGIYTFKATLTLMDNTTEEWNIQFVWHEREPMLQIEDSKYTYLMGEEFKPFTIIETNYKNEVTRYEITSSMVEGFDSLTEGEKKLKITYAPGKVYEMIINVDFKIPKADLEYLIIENPKLEYMVGEDFGYVYGYYRTVDSEYSEVRLNSSYVKGFDSSKPGLQKVTVTLNNKSEDYYIYVYANTPKVSLVSFNSLYERNSEFSGGKLRVITDNKTEYIDITKEMLTGFDTTSVGRKEVTITYNGHEFKAIINVVESKAEIEKPIQSNTSYNLASKLIAAYRAITYFKEYSSITSFQQTANSLSNNVSNDEAMSLKIAFDKSGIKNESLEAILNSIMSKGDKLSALYKKLNGSLVNIKDLNDLERMLLAEVKDVIFDNVTIDQLAEIITYTTSIDKDSFTQIFDTKKSKFINVLAKDIIAKINNKELNDYYNNLISNNITVDEARNLVLVLSSGFDLFNSIPSSLYMDLVSGNSIYDVIASNDYDKAKALGAFLSRASSDEDLKNSIDVLISYYKNNHISTTNKEFLKKENLLVSFEAFKIIGSDLSAILNEIGYADYMSISSFINFLEGNIHSYDLTLYKSCLNASKYIKPMIDKIYENKDLTQRIDKLYPACDNKLITSLKHDLDIMYEYYLTLDDLSDASYEKLNEIVNNALSSYRLKSNSIGRYKDKLFVVNKGISFAEFKEKIGPIYDATPESFDQNEIEYLEACLKVEGIHSFKKYDSYYDFYVVGENSNLVAMNYENSISNGLDYIAYIQNDEIVGIKNFKKGNYSSEVKMQSVKDYLDTIEISALDKDNNILLNLPLNTISYTYEIVYDKTLDGLNQGFIKINTSFGAYYTMINYTVVKERELTSAAAMYTTDNIVIYGASSNFILSFNYGFELYTHYISNEYTMKLGINSMSFSLEDKMYNYVYKVVDIKNSGMPERIENFSGLLEDKPLNEGVNFPGQVVSYFSKGQTRRSVSFDEFMENIANASYCSVNDLSYNVRKIAGSYNDYIIDIYRYNSLLCSYDFVIYNIISNETSISNNLILDEIDDLNKYLAMSDDEIIAYAKNKINNLKLNVTNNYCNLNSNGFNALEVLKKYNIEYTINVSRVDDAIIIRFDSNDKLLLQYTITTKEANLSVFNKNSISFTIYSDDDEITPAEIRFGMSKMWNKIEFKYSNLKPTDDILDYLLANGLKYTVTVEGTNARIDYEYNGIKDSIYCTIQRPSVSDISATYNDVYKPAALDKGKLNLYFNSSLDMNGFSLRVEDLKSAEIINSENHEKDKYVIHTVKINFNGVYFVVKIRVNYLDITINDVYPDVAHVDGRFEYLNDEEKIEYIKSNIRFCINYTYNNVKGIDINDVFKEFVSLEKIDSYYVFKFLNQDGELDSVRVFVKNSFKENISFEFKMPGVYNGFDKEIIFLTDSSNDLLEVFKSSISMISSYGKEYSVDELLPYIKIENSALYIYNERICSLALSTDTSYIYSVYLNKITYSIMPSVTFDKWLDTIEVIDTYDSLGIIKSYNTKEEMKKVITNWNVDYNGQEAIITFKINGLSYKDIIRTAA